MQSKHRLVSSVGNWKNSIDWFSALLLLFSPFWLHSQYVLFRFGLAASKTLFFGEKHIDRYLQLMHHQHWAKSERVAGQKQEDWKYWKRNITNDDYDWKATGNNESGKEANDQRGCGPWYAKCWKCSIIIIIPMHSPIDPYPFLYSSLSFIFHNNIYFDLFDSIQFWFVIYNQNIFLRNNSSPATFYFVLSCSLAHLVDFFSLLLLV